MNGVHDLGGMHGFGPIQYETNEPVFHSPWEARVYALTRAIRAWGRFSIDAWRFDIEQLPPPDYLRLSYYEKWLAALEKQVIRYGFVTPEEFASGKAASNTIPAKPALTPEAARSIRRGIQSAEDPAVVPLFHLGEKVRARNVNPTGHTRLPRYVRGRVGHIAYDHGVYIFPDTNAHGLGEHRQHVYSVRFEARELWGEQASPRDCVYLDLWDEYLEHT